jgi:hypothetical protein
MRAVVWGLLCACSSPTLSSNPDAAEIDSSDPIVINTPLEIRSLGVQGFVLRHGRDVVVTAPLFTRQSAFEVTVNLPLASDVAAVSAGLAGIALDDVRAVVSGHAHYDHLLDVPRVLEQAPHSIAYTNSSGQHILAALAPDRPGCTSAQPQPMIARDRVVALDSVAGQWVRVPDSQVRIMAIHSMHPAQVGPYHFGEGSIDTDQCELPRAASGWLEGETLALLIDFVDAADKPLFRVYYQDAPTNAPIGHIPATLLGDKQVDVALLCVGSSDSVTDHPTAILANTNPRFALSGHWEDFFQSATAAPKPIPLLDLDGYLARAEAALPGRHTLVQPGSILMVPPAP